LSGAGCGEEFRRSEIDAAGFVLAGGQSSRMGRDKALVEFAGRPLVAHALSILQQAGLAASIAGAQSDLAAFAPVVSDSEAGRGPLSGVCAALASTVARYSVFLSVDLPLLPPSLIVYLLHDARITGNAVTVASVAGFDQTFPAVIDRAVLSDLQTALEVGNGGCFAAFQDAAASHGRAISSVAVELLAQSAQVTHPQGLAPAHWFLNINAAEDLKRAEKLYARRIA
jgi:molybdenum cofactor guanylyltransferase